jgi:hypothetical protein
MTHRGHDSANQVIEAGLAEEDWGSETEAMSTAHYKVLGAGASSSGLRRDWDYVGVYSVENVSIVPKQYVAGFRLAGGRVAELRQVVLALNRWGALQKKEVVYPAPEKLLEQFRSAKHASARIAALESENEKLRANANVLRRLVAKNASDRERTQPTPEPDVLTKASEFLIILPPDYRPLALTLFEAGRLSVEDTVRELGVEAAQHFANLLGWAELGYVSGSVLVATRLGIALGETLKGLPEPAKEPHDPSNRR